jgi:threonine dehydratase
MRPSTVFAARIVMPLMTPLVKVAATSNYGADVILHGADYDEACAEAIRQGTADGLTFLHPFDDDEIIAGQGTIGLELLEQVTDLEAVVVPIGGGGLIGGVACAIKESRPHIRVIGVQTERLPSMLRAREAGHPGHDSGRGHHRRRHCGAASRRAYRAAGREIC